MPQLDRGDPELGGSFLCAVDYYCLHDPAELATHRLEDRIQEQGVGIVIMGEWMHQIAR